jgi:hypothetical protein
MTTNRARDFPRALTFLFCTHLNSLLSVLRIFFAVTLMTILTMMPVTMTPPTMSPHHTDTNNDDNNRPQDTPREIRNKAEIVQKEEHSDNNDDGSNHNYESIIY